MFALLSGCAGRGGFAPGNVAPGYAAPDAAPLSSTPAVAAPAPRSSPRSSPITAAPSLPPPPRAPRREVAQAGPSILPAAILPVPAWAQKTQSTSWSSITERALDELGQALMTEQITDAQDFCPKFSSLAQPQKKTVWVQMISSMAKYESGFNPLSSYVENFKGRAGHFIVSRGLLQISKDSANDYGCEIKSETDLENPETNLRCGVRIMNALVSRWHAIHGLQSLAPPQEHGFNPFRGIARYWEVLRSKTKDLLIRASVRQLPICQA